MNAFTPAPDTDDASPAGTSGAQSMMGATERPVGAERRSTAEMLQELRRAYPDAPLAVRVRALEALRRR